MPAHFAVDLKELREKVPPPLDDDFARSMGPFADLAALRAEIRSRLERNALDRARHEFSDRIIEYATANATLELPDVLIDQEVEVMHDEFRGSLARQGITEEAYLGVVGKGEADLHAEFRPQAEKRVKVLLVLSRIADVEAVEIGDAEVAAEHLQQLVEKDRQRRVHAPGVEAGRLQRPGHQHPRAVADEAGDDVVRQPGRAQVLEHVVGGG